MAFWLLLLGPSLHEFEIVRVLAVLLDLEDIDESLIGLTCARDHPLGREHEVLLGAYLVELFVRTGVVEVGGLPNHNVTHSVDIDALLRR